MLWNKGLSINCVVQDVGWRWEACPPSASPHHQEGVAKQVFGVVHEIHHLVSKFPGNFWMIPKHILYARFQMLQWVST